MIRRNKFDLFLISVLVFTLYVMIREAFSPPHTRMRLSDPKLMGDRVYKKKLAEGDRINDLSGKANVSALNSSSQPATPHIWFPEHRFFEKKLNWGAPPKKIAITQPSVLKSGQPPLNITDTKIPKIIWQKWKSRIDPTNIWQQEPYIRDGWLTWQAFNREYEHIVFSDADAELFVRREYAHRPDIVKVFLELQQRIIAFDLLRYLVIYRYGGIYNDMDTMCMKPIDEWFPDFLEYGAVVGIECIAPIDVGLPLDRQLDALQLVYPVQFLQWTVMAAPEHPLVNSTIEALVARIYNDTMEDGVAEWEIGDLWYEPMAILNVSGPGLWTRSVKNYINEAERRYVLDGEYANLQDVTIYGDVLLLPQEKWAPTGSGQQDDVAFLKHFWRGSWR